MNFIDILKKYNKDIHLKKILDRNTELFNFSYIKSDKWQTDDDVPYIVKTHLLDSYYCLPERPDMAFTFLWKCLNNSYNELFIRNNPTSTKKNQRYNFYRYIFRSYKKSSRYICK